MMRAQGLSASKITRLYCNLIKLQENRLMMVYSAVHVCCSLLCIFLLTYECVHGRFCMCGCCLSEVTVAVIKKQTGKGATESALGRRWWATIKY